MSETFNQKGESMKKTEWEKQQEIFDQIKKLGFQGYVDKMISDISKAFELKDRTCRCIDEGTPGGIHIAGSGILLSQEKAIEYLNNAKASGITSHEGCGAAALAGKDAIEWAKELSKKSGIPYVGHITAQEMNRPSEMHDARVVYYDGVGDFDYNSVNDLPKGFIISRKYIEKDYALDELGVSVDIAQGGHGFGDLFTEENPFHIIVIGKSNDIDGIKKEVIEKISDRDNVKVETLIV